MVFICVFNYFYLIQYLASFSYINHYCLLCALKTSRLTNKLFSVPLKKGRRIDKNGEEITKNISYILQFIDSARSMASTLSNLVNNLSEGIHRIKYKFGRDDKKCETCGIRYKFCDYFLE